MQKQSYFQNFVKLKKKIKNSSEISHICFRGMLPSIFRTAILLNKAIPLYQVFETAETWKTCCDLHFGSSQVFFESFAWKFSQNSQEAPTMKYIFNEIVGLALGFLLPGLGLELHQ